MTKGGYVYIMTNFTHSVLYTGVTARIAERICEHRIKSNSESFTAKYNVYKLVYYKKFATIKDAIAEEKRIKGGSRLKKIELVNSINPEWNDLFNSI